MRRRARPCASIRVHALQCAPMRLLVQPVLYSVPAAGRLAPQLACRQPPSLPHAVQNVLLL